MDVTNHMKRILYYIEAIRSIVLQLEGDGSTLSVFDTQLEVNQKKQESIEWK